MNGTKHKNIEVINYIKCFAIFSVIVLHCNLSQFEQRVIALPFFIQLAVPIFVIITGFTYSLSAERHCGDGSLLKNYFSPKNVWNKFNRLFFAYVFIFAAEMVIDLARGGSITVKHLIKLFFTGGALYPGSYYIPVIIQFIIIFPFMLWLYKKTKLFSFLITAGVQIIYELAIYKLQIDDAFTRLLAVRYLFFLLCGIAIYHCRMKKPKAAVMAVSMLVGAAYITAVGYFDFHPQILFATWTSSALPTAFFIAPIIYFILYKSPDSAVLNKLKIGFFGKASYHIYLFQMLYFGVLSNRFESSLLNVLAAVAVCFAAGSLFYIIETEIRKKIKAR